AIILTSDEIASKSKDEGGRRKDEVKTGGRGDGETGRSEQAAARLIAPSPRLQVSLSVLTSSFTLQPSSFLLSRPLAAGGSDLSLAGDKASNKFYNPARSLCENLC